MFCKIVKSKYIINDYQLIDVNYNLILDLRIVRIDNCFNYYFQKYVSNKIKFVFKSIIL